jgi:hypothetical protein
MPRVETGSEEHDNGLPAPGSRWGAGAQSVLPFLTRSLQARPAHAPEPREAPERALEAARQDCSAPGA